MIVPQLRARIERPTHSRGELQHAHLSFVWIQGNLRFGRRIGTPASILAGKPRNSSEIFSYSRKIHGLAALLILYNVGGSFPACGPPHEPRQTFPRCPKLCQRTSLPLTNATVISAPSICRKISARVQRVVARLR